VTWNFGNPESGFWNSDIRMTGQTVDHIYSGITSTSPVNTTVRAVAATGESTIPLTLKPPAAKIGIVGTNIVVNRSNYTDPPAIVLGDVFRDLSDGDSTGHIVDWWHDGPLTTTAAGGTRPVGDCGPHALAFLAKYGRVTGLAVEGVPFTAELNPFNYTVRPFAAAISGPVSSGDHLSFTSTSRPSGGAYTYEWAMIGPNGQPIVGGVGSNIWLLPKQFFKDNPGSKVRLRITSAGTLPAGCESFNDSVAETAPIFPPDPKINLVGCANNGEPPCSFVAASENNRSMSDWTYEWRICSDIQQCNEQVYNTQIAPTNGAGPTFAPVATVTNTYPIWLRATNAIGSTSVRVDQRLTAPLCPTMIGDVNVWVKLAGPGCTENSTSQCTPGQYAFDVGNLQFGNNSYSFSCAPHTFQWNIDGQQASTQQVSRTLAAGAHSASVTVSNGAQTLTLTKNFNVGGFQQPPPNNPPPSNPPPAGCATMTSGVNVFITFSGGCSEMNPTNCPLNQEMTFRAGAFNYNYECAPHTFSWMIDGQSKSGQVVTHTFSSSGQKQVSLTISNSSQTVPMNASLTVGSGGGQPPNPPPGGSCNQMNQANVFVSYRDAGMTCNEINGVPCPAGQAISFTASAALNYSFACAGHTFNWTFPGGTQSGKDAQYTFPSSGTYPVSVRISNGTQTFDATANVVVGTGGPITGGTEVTVSRTVVNGTLWKFEAHTDPPEDIDRAATAEWVFTGGSTTERQTKAPREAAYYDCHNWCATATVSVTLRNAQGQPLGAPANEPVIPPAPPRRRAAGR
jgi:hypothetical protein